MDTERMMAPYLCKSAAFVRILLTFAHALKSFLQAAAAHNVSGDGKGSATSGGKKWRYLKGFKPVLWQDLYSACVTM